MATAGASHQHDASYRSQNLGNSLGTRPCVRQTPLYRRHESGNAMKDLLGMGHLAWDNRGNASFPAAADVARQSAFNGRFTSGGSAGAFGGCDGGRFDAAAADADFYGGGGGFVAHRGQPGDDWFRNVAAADGDCYIDAAAPRSGSGYARAPLNSAVDLAQGYHGHAREDSATAPGAAASRGGRAGSGRAGGSSTGRGRGRGRGRGGGGYPDPVAATASGKRSPSCPARAAPVDARPRTAPSCSGGGGRAAEDSAAARPRSSGGPARSGSTPAPKLSRSRFDGAPVAPAFGVVTHGSSHFVQEYARGTLPCRIDHRGSTNRLSWDQAPEELPSPRRESLMILCAEGLRETRHPYATLSRLAFADLARVCSSGPIDDDALRKIMGGLRLALLVTNCTQVFSSALEALEVLAEAEGERLVPHMHVVLPPIGKRFFTKAHQDEVQRTLATLSLHGGPEAIKVMTTRGLAPRMG